MFFQQFYCTIIVLHLSLEIMCMHFILSSPHTSSHICNHINYKKNCNIFSKNEVAGPRKYLTYRPPLSLRLQIQEIFQSFWVSLHGSWYILRKKYDGCFNISKPFFPLFAIKLGSNTYFTYKIHWDRNKKSYDTFNEKLVASYFELQMGIVISDEAFE